MSFVKSCVLYPMSYVCHLSISTYISTKTTHMENQNPLDSLNIENESNYELAATWKRLVNFILDYLAIMGIVIGIIVIAPTIGPDGSPGKFYFLFYCIFFLYYAIMEAVFGRTIGKFITGTVVIRETDLEKITANQALGRSISRFVPFEPFSMLGSQIGQTPW